MAWNNKETVLSQVMRLLEEGGFRQVAVEFGEVIRNLGPFSLLTLPSSAHQPVLERAPLMVPEGHRLSTHPDTTMPSGKNHLFYFLSVKTSFPKSLSRLFLMPLGPELGSFLTDVPARGMGSPAVRPAVAGY